MAPVVATPYEWQTKLPIQGTHNAPAEDSFHTGEISLWAEMGGVRWACDRGGSSSQGRPIWGGGCFFIPMAGHTRPNEIPPDGPDRERVPPPFPRMQVDKDDHNNRRIRTDRATSLPMDFVSQCVIPKFAGPSATDTGWPISDQSPLSNVRTPRRIYAAGEKCTFKRRWNKLRCIKLRKIQYGLSWQPTFHCINTCLK